MQSLSVAEAIRFVRKNLDEQNINPSDMIGMLDSDSTELDSLIGRNLPEALNAIHASAVAHRLEGRILNIDEALVCEDGSLEFKPGVDDFLRLVSFETSGSPYVMTRAVAEDSSEGRMQKNRYSRGTWDNPTLVLLGGSFSSPSFRYYSPRTAGEAEQMIFTYLPEQKYSDVAEAYEMASGLSEPVLNHLTGLVLQTYKDNDLAAVFFQRAAAAIQ